MLALDPRFDVLAVEEACDAVDPRYAYIEAQIHGRVGLSDIEEVVFTLGQEPPDTMSNLLSSIGIGSRTVEGAEP